MRYKSLIILMIAFLASCGPRLPALPDVIVPADASLGLDAGDAGPSDTAYPCDVCSDAND